MYLLGVYKKFGMVIGKTGNAFVSKLGESKNCHKLIQKFGYGKKGKFQVFESNLCR